MLARLSSVVRGHSAVSQAAIDAIEALLTHNLTPVIPARGSISASGDLIPLSYLAGVLQGNPDIYVRVLLPAAPTPSDPNPRPTTTILPSPLALRMAKLSPLTLGAKEGLGLLNGTAASASVAAITLQEANCLALLTQMLTAMMCEAMAGSAGSFAAFIAAARPHRGQIEAAANIRSALAGSRLAQSHTSGTDAGDLAQDRYALRTAPQWIGPYLEDLALATEQVSVELVSTTDNPLVDPDTGVIHHGGNFQATSLTSAMDKTRVALAQLGALLFAQANELVDPARNRGLPPNLAPDNPSTSFFGKGLDISVAAYSAELAFLAAPAGIHMRSAEMHNQSVNSMALLGARMAAQSVEVASMLAAAALVLVCQGLDLRVLRTRFADTLALDLETLTDPAYLLEHYPALAAALAGPARMPGLLPTALAAWDATGALDLGPRCVRVAERVTAELTAELQRRAVAQVAAAARTARESNSAEPGASGLTIFAELAGWTAELACNLEDFYETARADMYAEHANITPGYLGSGTRRVYEFVRGLGVGLHKGREDDPLNEGVEGEGKKTIGGLAGRVYAAIRGGEIYEAVVEGLRG
ncbi:PAL-domain-containing protein [Trichodelitschia bisporula]|uniref:PAL-domain-containing protein n=1 Tax=Trichodelitschia bisporula TaxID=703511 RepID=A0A6G1HUU4_9PEZI|nr:PAL-domain-containing protein [Trichodelitschia bisporula]